MVIWFGCSSQPYAKGKPWKLQKPWSGPYRIQRKRSEVTYQIQHTGYHKLNVVHFSRLKHCLNSIRLPARKSPPVPSSEPAESPPVGSSLELLEEEEPRFHSHLQPTRATHLDRDDLQTGLHIDGEDETRSYWKGVYVT